MGLEKKRSAALLKDTYLKVKIPWNSCKVEAIEVLELSQCYLVTCSDNLNYYLVSPFLFIIFTEFWRASQNNTNLQKLLSQILLSPNKFRKCNEGQRRNELCNNLGDTKSYTFLDVRTWSHALMVFGIAFTIHTNTHSHKQWTYSH